MMDIELYKTKVLELFFFHDIVVPEWAIWLTVEENILNDDDLAYWSFFVFHRVKPHLSCVSGVYRSIGSQNIYVPDLSVNTSPLLCNITDYDQLYSLMSIEELFNGQ